LSQVHSRIDDHPRPFGIGFAREFDRTVAEASYARLNRSFADLLVLPVDLYYLVHFTVVVAFASSPGTELILPPRRQ
jgi:hypothetical protein